VASVAGGQTCRAIAELFNVSVASVVKCSQRARSTGNAAARKIGGRRPFLLEGERGWLLARLAEKPDLTLHALLAELRERDIVVACTRCGGFCAARGSASKKTVFASEQNRPTSRAAAPGGKDIKRRSTRRACLSPQNRRYRGVEARHRGDGPMSSEMHNSFWRDRRRRRSLRISSRPRRTAARI
jgi:transposase